MGLTLSSVQILSSAPLCVQVCCYDMCMILSDAVGNAELTKWPIHWKMAVQVRRFNRQAIGLGQYFPI